MKERTGIDSWIESTLLFDCDCVPKDGSRTIHAFEPTQKELDRRVEIEWLGINEDFKRGLDQGNFYLFLSTLPSVSLADRSRGDGFRKCCHSLKPTLNQSRRRVRWRNKSWRLDMSVNKIRRDIWRNKSRKRWGIVFYRVWVPCWVWVLCECQRKGKGR